MTIQVLTHLRGYRVLSIASELSAVASATSYPTALPTVLSPAPSATPTPTPSAAPITAANALVICTAEELALWAAADTSTAGALGVYVRVLSGKVCDVSGTYRDLMPKGA